MGILKKFFGENIDLKAWGRLSLFSLNNCATNTYMFLMMYVSYYATGVAGLGVAIIGIIGTVSRLWDGITDPFVGMFIDKTNGKFGKFRPCMVIGQVIMAGSTLLMYTTVHRVPQSFRLIYYILVYAVYIIGYTFQTACTKGGLSCIASTSADRTSYTFFDTVYGSVLWAILPVVASGVMFEKAGGFTEQYFLHFTLLTIAISAVLTILAIIGIWSHDRKEYFGSKANQENEQKITFHMFLDAFKGNKPLRMLVYATVSDKLAAMVKSNAVLMVVLFGILLGNYSLYGTASSITVIPSIIIALFGTGYAIRKGLKKAMWNITTINVVSCLGLLALSVMAYLNGGLSPVLVTVFLAVYCLLYCCEALNSALIYPMLADITDYESVRSGNYIPGMISTLFSFVDKLVSSLGTTIVALGLVAIGYADTQPSPTDALTSPLFIFLLVMYFALPLVGWLVNYWSLSNYDLTNEKMDEIHAAMAAKK